MLKRVIEDKIEKYLQGEDYKTFYIWGPRRSGKTTLLKQLSKNFMYPCSTLIFHQTTRGLRLHGIH